MAAVTNWARVEYDVPWVVLSFMLTLFLYRASFKYIVTYFYFCQQKYSDRHLFSDCAALHVCSREKPQEDSIRFCAKSSCELYRKLRPSSGATSHTLVHTFIYLKNMLRSFQ